MPGTGLNTGATAIAIAIMTLSIAHCAHVMTSMQLAWRDGAGRLGSVVESLLINLAPTIISSR